MSADQVADFAASATSGQQINVALATNGGTVTASSQYNSNFPAAAANDGDRFRLYRSDGTYNIWHSAPGISKPDWLEVSFASAKTVTEVDIITMQDDYANAVEPTVEMASVNYGLSRFEVQYWTGSAWATVSGGSITGNNKVWRKFTFPAVTTSKMRVLVHQTMDAFSRIVEVEAWGTNAQSPATSSGETSTAPTSK